jgi:CBS domain-containing protein
MVPADMTVERLVNDHILTSSNRCFAVIIDNRPAGLVTLQNVRTVPQELRNQETVGEIMVPFDKLKWVTPEENLSNVLQILTESDINQVPVLDNNGRNIIGMVSRTNLLTFIDIRGGLGA